MSGGQVRKDKPVNSIKKGVSQERGEVAGGGGGGEIERGCGRLTGPWERGPEGWAERSRLVKISD